jgi:hypothetical protein
MAVNMVAAADAAQFKSERLDQSTELGEIDVSKFAGAKTLPQIVSAGARQFRSIKQQP